MFSVFRPFIPYTAAFSLLSASIFPAGAVPPTVTIEECQNLQDPDVRAKIRDLTEQSLKTELAGVDFKQLVDQHWNSAKMDQRIDSAIDEAVTAVRADTSWLDRAYSNVSQSTAEKYAIAVAERAYGSQAFKDALSELSMQVGRYIGGRIERSTERVSGPIIACVQSTLQTRYGSAVSQVFAQETEQSIKLSPESRSAKIEATDLALQGGATISGIILIVSRRVIARMVTQIGTRIAGAIASRIIATFTGLVGLALIASDLYQAGDGVFPLIAERMKSQESKDLIRQEIVKTLQTDITEQLADIGAETADRIYSLWLDFRQKYNKLLDLSDKNATFSAFLKDRKIDQLGRLGQLVDIILSTEGEPGVFRRNEDGSLGRALLDLNDTGVAIAADRKSIDVALKWTALAGRDLDNAVKYDLPKFISPDELTKEQLQKLLALDDRVAIGRLANLDASAREQLLTLSTQQVREIASRLTVSELQAFSNYQRQLTPAAARRVTEAIGENPAVIRVLARQSVQNGVLNSRDQIAALDMLLGGSSPIPDVGRVFTDFEIVKDGRVNYRIFWEAHMFAVILAALVTLILLLWLRRLIFGRPYRSR